MYYVWTPTTNEEVPVVKLEEKSILLNQEKLSLSNSQEIMKIYFSSLFSTKLSKELREITFRVGDRYCCLVTIQIFNQYRCAISFPGCDLVEVIKEAYFFLCQSLSSEPFLRIFVASQSYRENYLEPVSFLSISPIQLVYDFLKNLRHIHLVISSKGNYMVCLPLIIEKEELVLLLQKDYTNGVISYIGAVDDSMLIDEMFCYTKKTINHSFPFIEVGYVPLFLAVPSHIGFVERVLKNVNSRLENRKITCNDDRFSSLTAQINTNIFKSCYYHILLNKFKEKLKISYISNSILFDTFVYPFTIQGRRMQLLGDSYLELISYIYEANLYLSESGERTNKKKLELHMVSNKNLYNIAIKYRYYEYIFVDPLNKGYTPFIIYFGNKDSKFLESCFLKSIIHGKSLADLMEGLIAANLIHFDFELISASSIFEKLKITDRLNLNDLLRKINSCIKSEEANEIDTSVFEYLEKITSHVFNRKKILSIMFLHREIIRKIGQSLVRFLLTLKLYKEQPFLNVCRFSCVRDIVLSPITVSSISANLALSEVFTNYRESLNKTSQKYEIYQIPEVEAFNSLCAILLLDDNLGLESCQTFLETWLFDPYKLLINGNNI